MAWVSTVARSAGGVLALTFAFQIHAQDVQRTSTQWRPARLLKADAEEAAPERSPAELAYRPALNVPRIRSTTADAQTGMSSKPPEFTIPPSTSAPPPLQPGETKVDDA